MKENILKLITLDKDNINIFENERRLVLLAVIKAKGNLRQAFKINAPKHLTFEGYVKKFYRYKVPLKELKTIKL